MKFTEEQKTEIRKFFSNEVSVDLFKSDLDKLESLIFNNNSIPIEPPVMQKIADILNELFEKYTEEKFSNYKHTEYYVGGLQDGKLIALAEIKERLSNFSA